MCGTVAAIGDGSTCFVEMGLSMMLHRGIRSRVAEVLGGAIGHVRLPIVGVGEDHDQPVCRGPWTVAFVGEILDFREHDPGAECDVDLVADAWAESGPVGFRGFDGFWHVVAHDSRDGSLHVLSDYLAQKPVYLRRDRSAVASELDALARMGPVTPDAVYLSSAVKWGYCPETWRTPYSEIRRLLPGEHLTIRLDGSCSSEISDPLDPLPGSPEFLKSEIEKAVSRRVSSSDVPVACLVSGGLDSAIVWALAGRTGDVHAYHVENGEKEDCLKVAPCAEILEFADIPMEKALEYMQEPLDLGSLTPQVALSDAISAAGRERVCLTGDGADEMFGGYGRAWRYDSQASDVWHELVAWHLPRLDRVMMKNCVEVRSPFLARRVAAAALALPRGVRMGKKILRDLFRGDLPPGVADVPKRPLRTPQVEEDRESNSMKLIQMFQDRYRR